MVKATSMRDTACEELGHLICTEERIGDRNTEARPTDPSSDKGEGGGSLAVIEPRLLISAGDRAPFTHSLGLDHPLKTRHRRFIAHHHWLFVRYFGDFVVA